MMLKRQFAIGSAFQIIYALHTYTVQSAVLRDCLTPEDRGLNRISGKGVLAAWLSG